MLTCVPMQKNTQRQIAFGRLYCRLQSVCRAAAGQPDDAAREFLDSINRKRGSYGPQGSEPAQPQPYTREMMGKEMLGEDGYKRFEEIKRGERQRGRAIVLHTFPMCINGSCMRSVGCFQAGLVGGAPRQQTHTHVFRPMYHASTPCLRQDAPAASYAKYGSLLHLAHPCCFLLAWWFSFHTHTVPPLYRAVWENIRASAEVRFRLGLMPDWFNPDWLERKEAPLNELERTASNPSNEQDHEAVLGGSDGGDGMGSGSGSGPGGGDGGYWREEDPYWPLRDWGDHPMRWWTLAFGLLMAGAWGHASMHGHMMMMLMGARRCVHQEPLQCALEQMHFTSHGFPRLSAHAQDRCRCWHHAWNATCCIAAASPTIVCV